jgi:histidinol phosphatase-like PHP family hydrolase
MPFDLFSKPGHFLRGNLHTHSSRSDGGLAPEEVSRRYRAMGYDFYCLSDHFLKQYNYPITNTVGHRQTGFTTLLGAELHAGQTSLGEIWHILAVGLPHDFAITHDGESGPELARRAVAAGAFVAIAHPQWYGLTVEDARELAFVHAVEIYNHTCNIRHDRPDGTALLDRLLEEGCDFTAIATDDAHFIDRTNQNSDAFGGWVMVKVTEPTPEAILAALKQGHFYASQGPEFHDLAIKGDLLLISCTAVERVIVLGPPPLAKIETGHSMTKAEIDISRYRGKWLRVAIMDAAGRHAWSNPVRLPT